MAAMSSPQGWRAHLEITYRHEGGRTLAHDRHEGPLRVLQPLYPEGSAICHHVLLHPPGGIVGGDELEIDLRLGPGTHALATTAGATRFYRSDGRRAVQRARLRLEPGSRLEWLPLETIAFPGCDASNEVSIELHAGAEMIGWDLLALGLPAAGAAFTSGVFRQCLQWPGHWLERARIDAADTALLDGPLGLAGHGLVATLWWASGSALPAVRREALLASARALLEAGPLAATSGATAPAPALVVVRVLADRVEPALTLLADVRASWRAAEWGLARVAPRVWRT